MPTAHSTIYPIERTDNHGKIITIVKERANFWEDIHPYFASGYIILFSHICYWYTGSFAIPFWAICG